MKPGTKLKSAVCDTEVMVIRATGDGVVACGGAPMADTRPQSPGEIDPEFAGGSKIGKRYVDPDGRVELLCVKAGAGSLSLGRVALHPKDAKPLPSSD